MISFLFSVQGGRNSFAWFGLVWFFEIWGGRVAVWVEDLEMEVLVCWRFGGGLERSKFVEWAFARSISQLRSRCCHFS